MKKLIEGTLRLMEEFSPLPVLLIGLTITIIGSIFDIFFMARLGEIILTGLAVVVVLYFLLKGVKLIIDANSNNTDP